MSCQTSASKQIHVLGGSSTLPSTESSKLDSEEADRYRHRLTEDSTRLFEAYANSFVLLRLEVDRKCKRFFILTVERVWNKILTTACYRYSDLDLPCHWN